MAERFLRGGRLLAFGRGHYATDAQHVSVEFVHPVIVGKRALPARPLLALGGDLKNTITLVVNGEAFVSQHLGDLGNFDAFRAFQETVRDLTAMYEVEWGELLIVHDQHPEYLSSLYAQTLA